jgi:eukaryotic-like serine/threonine-protein kinase
MNPDRWPEVEALLDAALDLPLDARGALLDDPAAGDPAVRAEVRRLLEGMGDVDGFLRGTAAEFAAPLVAAADEGSGDLTSRKIERVGPYRILREIGRGGMAAVYLAERDDDQFRMQVALKLVPRGMDSAHALRRFREERQILASLEHPHIARLLDGGVTHDGLPWFALEYVAGVPIDRYCDEHALGIEARLALFCKVCDAVQFAHRNLVVHRDLKPSNIMVSDDGEPKLLDFGIAKLLETGATADEPLTRTGTRVLTPEYASPEQVKDEAITTATDVYSLGVLLFELLTGRRPYRLSTRSPLEAERAIVEVEPDVPSTCVTRDGPPLDQDASPTDATPPNTSAQSLSQARGSTPERLRRRLRGDLDTIVLMALRKEPSRRYASVEQLASDVRRHLEGRPVSARRDSRRYRTGKFLRRNRAAVVAVAAVLALAAGGATFHSVEVSHQRNVARQEAAKAEQVAEFLVDLFRQSDPYGPAAATLSIADILQIGGERLERELIDQPDVRATLMSVVGRVYENLGRLDEAAGLELRAFDIRRGLLPSDHLDIASSLDRLGRVHFRKGDFASADTLLSAALVIRRARLGERHELVAEGINNMAALRLEQGDLAAADSLNRQVLALRRETLGASHPHVALSLNNLAVVARRLGEYDEAETYHREALAIRRSHYGAEHPLVAATTKNLALALHSQYRFAEAKAMYQDALDIQVRLLGDRHPEVGMTLNSLASLLRMEGQYADAEPLFSRALALQREALGPAHPQLANTLDNLAGLMRERGDLAGAERHSREGLAMRQQLLAADHPAVATGLNSLGIVLRDRGAFDQAETLIQQAVAITTARLGPDHQFTATMTHNLASVAHRRGDAALAESRYGEALASFRANPAGLHVNAAATLIGLADILLASGRPAEAEPLLREAYDLRRAELPADHWQIAEAGIALGHALATLNRREEATPLIRSGLEALAGREGIDQERGRQRAIDQLRALTPPSSRPPRSAALSGSGG